MLRDFYSHPGWDLVRHGLHELMGTHQANLNREEDMTKVARLQGRIQGLTEAINLREVFFPPRVGGRGQ